MKQNYQLWLDKEIEKTAAAGTRPRLLLHACCAPCSSYVIEYLSLYFDITLYFYNPNISPKAEHDFRYAELERLVKEMGLSENVRCIEADYTPELFRAVSLGLEELPEGGERCKKCYALRLEQTAKAATVGKYDYFTTTLSISPYKNAEWLCNIGAELEEKYGVKYLYSDFKKRGGYKRSCELSGEYALYRQDYCGCAYSKRDRDKRTKESTAEK